MIRTNGSVPDGRQFLLLIGGEHAHVFADPIPGRQLHNEMNGGGAGIGLLTYDTSAPLPSPTRTSVTTPTTTPTAPSANPTLDTLASVLAEVGYKVEREYYVNDAGRQMDILCVSVWFRYLELAGEHVKFPVNGYKGEYVRGIAASLREKHGDEFRRPFADIMQGVPADEPEGDKDAHVDGIIVQAKKLLGKPAYRSVFGAGLHAMREDIREDLAEFGVVLVADSGVDQEKVAPPPDQQTVGRHPDAVFGIRHLHRRPERLRHDPEHGSAVEAKLSIADQGQLQIT